MGSHVGQRMCGAKATSRSHDSPRPANLAAGQGSAARPQILKRGARPSGPGHTFAPLRSRRPYKPPALARLFPQADSSATLGSTVVMTTSWGTKDRGPDPQSDEKGQGRRCGRGVSVTEPSWGTVGRFL
uniref:Uncharacterized protein n=1 Tax=Rousettus aegyptiacus TaxID=9407 RepID=A0A7J8CIY6_ROUAE|nr:hypothetical protein HJG63_009243 [Rousettus aegyptiacus]